MAVGEIGSRWAVVVAASALVVGAGACQPPAEARSPENTMSVASEPSGASSALRAGPNVVGITCDGPDCEASCMAGSSILLAFGFHGLPYDANRQMAGELGGQAVEWLGFCLGKERCEVKTRSLQSAMYLVCR